MMNRLHCLCNLPLVQPSTLLALGNQNLEAWEKINEEHRTNFNQVTDANDIAKLMRGIACPVLCA
jgi:hypothetical protein